MKKNKRKLEGIVNCIGWGFCGDTVMYFQCTECSK